MRRKPIQTQNPRKAQLSNMYFRRQSESNWKQRDYSHYIRNNLTLQVHVTSQKQGQVISPLPPQYWKYIFFGKIKQDNSRLESASTEEVESEMPNWKWKGRIKWKPLNRETLPDIFPTQFQKAISQAQTWRQKTERLFSVESKLPQKQGLFHTHRLLNQLFRTSVLSRNG